MTNKPLDYHTAGVDIHAGNALVERIKPLAMRTHRPEVLGGLGGFGGLIELPAGLRKPVLVAGTDGVGTKLMLGIEMSQLHGLGIDLVAMCVNDIIVCGADPLLFLDYYASAALNVDAAATVIAGIGAGCEQAGAALLGGETAEMPGLYRHGDFDLAGFCVGVVEKDQIIDGSHLAPGDALIAIASCGPHANGFSLIRKILETRNQPLDQPFADTTLGAVLLRPTKIYVNTIKSLKGALTPHAIAHITGGGLTENIPRMLPAHLAARIATRSWQQPAIFSWLQEHGPVTAAEMRRTFNCGVGMVVAVAANHTDQALKCLGASGETAWQIGTVAAALDTADRITFDD